MQQTRIRTDRQTDMVFIQSVFYFTSQRRPRSTVICCCDRNARLAAVRPTALCASVFEVFASVAQLSTGVRIAQNEIRGTAACDGCGRQLMAPNCHADRQRWLMKLP
jgi:hypothetical protein